MRAYATIDERAGLGDIGRLAARAESIGYDGIFVPEAVHDGLLAAQAALAATSRLYVTTSVLVAFARSPMTVAVAARDLQAWSGGRFALGLGTQVRRNVEERYASPWHPPVERMREYVGALREVWRAFDEGDVPRFEGRHYRITRLQPFFNPGPIDASPIPIHLGAVMPRMTELAGEIADGLLSHPTNSSPRYLREVIQPRLAAGRANREHVGASAEIVAQCLVATGATRAQVRAQREHYRSLLAFLYSTPAYWPSLVLHGWSEVGRELNALARAGCWQEMTARIDDEILDTFVPSGTYDEIASVLRSDFEDLASCITLPMPPDAALDAAHSAAVAGLHE